MSQRQADYQAVRQKYPAIDSLKAADWGGLFDERPDILHKLLRDLYAITKAQQDESRKAGRRTKHINGTLDELWDMLSPRYSTDPFPIAVKEIMGGQSVRAFAPKVPMHYSTLTRLINGERKVVIPLAPEASMQVLEGIARAGHVHPAYFAEWRELLVLLAIQEVLQAKPTLTIQFASALSEAAER